MAVMNILRKLGPTWPRIVLFVAAFLGLSGCGSTPWQPVWPRGLSRASRAELLQTPPMTKPWNDAGRLGAIIHTRHYRIYTTLQSPLQRALCARVVEAAWRRFAALVPGTRVHSPLVGYIFRNRKEWAAHVRATAGSLATVYLHIRQGGYEQNGQFVIWRTGLNEMLSVLAHECWHQLSFRALQNHLPAWLDEGLATQNETFYWHNGQPVFTPWRNRPRWDALQAAYEQGQLLPLDTLTRTQAGDVIMKAAPVVRAYYAEVWSFMLFLEHSRYRSRLLRLLDEAHVGKLNRLLAGNGLSQRDIALQTIRWNSVAGPIFLRDCISRHSAKLRQRYLKFVRRMLVKWPPPPPQRRKGATVSDVARLQHAAGRG